ncbi:FAD-binding protein [Arthrobacter deserti]|uniref:FAD-binding protein n=1 Tax=Arthrobacter deserti TaxID=1742687 RepID=A0ABX1JNE4_9MICC|nr:FAD-binding protein [Arthrobacter deserti]
MSGSELPAESTTTVVIGAGLPGLAVASELSRHGVDSIVVEGLGAAAPAPRRSVMSDSVSPTEQSDLLRLLHGYAASRCLDVRRSTFARQVSLVPGPGMAVPGTGTAGADCRWMFRTERGVLLADTVVLTGCPENQMRRFLRGLGVRLGADINATLKSIGLYLVGMAGLLAPTTREIVRQAKAVGDATAGGRTAPA